MKIYRIAYLSIITTFLLLAAFSPVRAQSMSQYTFTPSSGVFFGLNGATVQRTINDNLDDGIYPLAPIGFNFKFNDVVYTTVSASTDGWMSFGRLAGNGNLENSLTSGLSRPFVAPLWDDLAVNRSNGSVSYITFGTAPNRQFRMQWINMQWKASAIGSTGAISFQVILYETTNVVQFVYRPEIGALYCPNAENCSASIGLAATQSGSGNFLSLSNSGTNPSVSTTTETTTIGTKPAYGQTYTFTPPAETGLEADVASRPNGDGSILSDDVVQIRRFLNGTNTLNPAVNEFQRADSAPFSTKGDGRILSDDVVQARRYQNGTNTFQAAGGPLAPAGNRASNADDIEAKANASEEAAARREIRIESATVSGGQTVTVNVLVDTQGDEAEYGFTLNYDRTKLSNPVIEAGYAGASVRSCNKATAGEINCSVGGFSNDRNNSGIGEAITGANQIIITVTFAIEGDAQAETTGLTLTNVNVSNDEAQLLPINSQNAMLSILASTAAAVSVSGRCYE